MSDQTQKIADLERQIVEAHTCEPMVNTEPLSEWLSTEIGAIDCRYRGDPTYDHDAYWMKSKVLSLIEKDKAIIDNWGVTTPASAVAAVAAALMKAEEEVRRIGPKEGSLKLVTEGFANAIRDIPRDRSALEEMLRKAIKLGIDAGAREAQDECTGRSDIRRPDVDAMLLRLTGEK